MAASTVVPSSATGQTWPLVRRFFGYYHPYRRLFAIDFTSAVISGVLELAFPVAVGIFVDRLLPDGDWAKIVAASIGLLAMYLFNTGLMVVVTYWGHVLGINIETDMRRLAFDHLQRMSFRFYDEQKTGHLVGRVTKDLEEVGRSRAPRARGRVHRPDDVRRRVRAHVPDQPPNWH